MDLKNVLYHEQTEAFNYWCNPFSFSEEDTPDKPKVQENWDIPACKRQLENLMENSISAADTARLKAVSQEHTSDWLNALPSSPLGL